MDDKGELQTTLEDLDKVERENKDLKENLDEANECFWKMKQQLKKFKERHKEVNEQAKQEIIGLKVSVEEKKRIEECFNTIVQYKSDECTKLDQEVVNLRIELEMKKLCENNFKSSFDKLRQLLAGQKSSTNKVVLGNDVGESSKENQMTRDKGKQKRNLRKFARRQSMRQPNAQRYPSFNGIFFSCNKYGHKATKCRSR